MSANPTLDAAIAAHRFGLGEADLGVVGGDPRGWLRTQIGPADAARGAGLLTTAEALALVESEREKRQQARNAPKDEGLRKAVAGMVRETALADGRSRLLTAATTTRPFAERLQLFWANHFTVALKGSTRGLVGAFERDAIRPHIAGSFDELLVAATTHAAMLRYLDNARSAGPHSRVVAFAARRAQRMGEGPRVTGLNENLAREVLELHTLGAEASRQGLYTQADVTAFAAVLTGWRVAIDGDTDHAQTFFPAWHEPGTKTLLGRTYPEGPGALRMVLHDLARHPATARHIATKLARHVVADAPEPAFVERLSAVFLRSDGQLAEVYRALVADDAAWSPAAVKLKTPEELVVSSARLLHAGERFFDRPEGNAAGPIAGLGQRLHAAPSPAGWSDDAADWLGPDAVWKRVEWATRVAERAGRSFDARKLAVASLGPRLGTDTARELANASDARQALALLLLAPEFQRR